MTHPNTNPAVQVSGVHRCTRPAELSAACRRLPAGHRRRGSVLILVVTLLVLMALAGTAYLATVRTDRISTAISSDIHQEQMLLDSAQALVEQKLIDDLQSTQRWDHPETDKWLADRVPVWVDIVNRPAWLYVTNLAQTADAYRLDSPIHAVSARTGQTMRSAVALEPVIDNGAPLFRLVGPGGYLSFIDDDGNPHNAWPAADADGDDIPDSPYFRLPIAPIDGVTYYMAARIIDNTAAINVNTAWDREADYAIGTGNPIENLGFFPSSIGLGQLLYPGSGVNSAARQMGRINQYRFGFTAGVFLPDIAPMQDWDWNAGVLRPAPQELMEFYSLGDALWHQLGRRIDIDNPGHRFADEGKPEANARFRAYTISDMVALAYRFCMRNPKVPPSTLEAPTSLGHWGISASVYDHPNIRDVGYYATVADPVLAWFGDNFDFDNQVPGNSDSRPVRTLLVTHNPVSTLAPPVAMSGTVAVPAGMAPYTGQPVPKANVNTASFEELWRAYWNVMRNAGGAPVPTEAATRMFRPAMRGSPAPGDWTPYEQLVLRAAIAAVNTIDLRDADDHVTWRDVQIGNYIVTVYGTEKQPFITEAVVYLQDSDAGDDWIGIELYNPYPLPTAGPIDISGWQLAWFDRGTGALHTLHTFPAGTEIAQGEFLALVSSVADAELVLGGEPGDMEEVSNLTDAIGHELVLLRPRMVGGSDPIDQMVPVDILDLRGFEVDPVDPSRYLYQRQAIPGDAQAAWRCVYPGPPTGTPPGFVADGDDLPMGPSGATLGAANPEASYSPTFQVPLNDFGWPGPNPIPADSSSPARFPFGGFARDGDILMVPFIGAYRIVSGSTIVELNAVTTDAAYAEADGVADDGRALGRFGAGLTDGTGARFTEYDWAADLFDHVTALSVPDQDYLPNVNVDEYAARRGLNPASVSDHRKVPQKVANGPVSTPVNANDGNEMSVGIHGRININTAPVAVLNMLPLVPGDPDANEALAREIAVNRVPNPTFPELTGPFESPFDLMRIPAFRESLGDPTSADFELAHGDITPGDGVLDDFEQHYLPLTRLSNLITTRSDSFTVYIVLEGWRDAGTPNATRVSQQRRAFIVDRSGYTPTNPRLKITPIPMD